MAAAELVRIAGSGLLPIGRAQARSLNDVLRRRDPWMRVISWRRESS